MSPSAPASVGEIQAFVKDHKRIHVIGNGSKPSLHPSAPDAAPLSMSGQTGIIEYQPQEFTLTVRAGTAVRELVSALARHQQYLPFDPLLPESATIGGTVAANLSGPRRFRFGGIRDFILGARVVDGLGRAFRVGGKVVKNAAGFDLSKFLVGSLGRYAIMTELTFKVFPEPPHFRALRLTYGSLQDVLTALYFLNQSSFELDALEFEPAADAWALLLCQAGYNETLPGRAQRLLSSLRANTALLDAVALDDPDIVWRPLTGLTGEYLVKVVLSPRQIPPLDPAQGHLQRRYSIGGNTAWVATNDIVSLERLLLAHDLHGLCIRGQVASPLLGKPPECTLASRVKQVLDPMNKLV